LFLLTFLTWAWFAFIRPPVFGRWNAKRYAQTLYSTIVRGDNEELAIIAKELARSAETIVALCAYPRQQQLANNENDQQPSIAARFANDLLLLIANRKFCRHIVESSPVTAMAFFDSMTRQQKYHIPIGQFAISISTQAIAHKESILYQEGNEYTSGLIGYIKPWSQTIYGNYDLVEVLGEGFRSPLDVDFRDQWSWDAEQWNAYCRVTLVAFEAYLKSQRTPYVINRALSDIEGAFRDLYKLNHIGDEWFESDIYKRLEAAVKFVKKAVALIDKQENPPRVALRRKEKHFERDIYDSIADLIFEIMFAASSIEADPDRCWGIHHNATWGEFFDLATDSKSWKIVKFKVRRLLFEEVARMKDYLNYKGARILGYLLNVMGFKVSKGRQGYGRDYRALAKVTQAWARRNYLRLREALPDVGDAVLIGRLSFDKERRRLVLTYFKGLNNEAPRDYLELDQPIVVPREDAAVERPAGSPNGRR
jgi:hypothetical protein